MVDMYRQCFEEHNQRVIDVHKGYIEVWDQGKGINAKVWVLNPGCELIGTGDDQRSVSSWATTSDVATRTTRYAGVSLLHGIDRNNRLLVSNNTGVIGGLTDTTVMRDLLTRVNKVGPIWGFVPRLCEWRDRSGNRRLSWGHPCLLLFRHEMDLDGVMVKVKQDLPRPDGGGNRMLKIEWSTGEVQYPAAESTGDRGDSDGKLGEVFSKFVSPRFDPGQCRDLRDGITASMEFEFDGSVFDVMGVPASEWPCNVGKSIRRFPGGKRGEPSDDYEVDPCE